MAHFLDTLAGILAFDDLKRNHQAVTPKSLLSLALLFAPALVFPLTLLVLKDTHPQFTWINTPADYPWQVWGISLFGLIATLGGAGDWVFHKIYVTVGPKEHESHLLALGAGGVVFVLMASASISDQPARFLLPVVIALLVTTILICYDEFAFHVRRCKPFETALHRMLVLGNGAAFLCWLHWVFVAR